MRVFGIIALVFVSLVLLFGAGVGCAWVTTTNKEVALRTQIVAKQKDNQSSFDAMWKILAQKAGVTDEYKEAFKEIYPKLIEGRNQDKNLLVKFVAESNPNFDTSLYKDLMVSIEAERKRFHKDQTLLLDYKREHDNLRLQFPSSLFLAHIQPIEVNIVTSEKTEETFRTGQDNDVNLFKKDKK